MGNDRQPQRILITGNMGYVGPAVVAHLRKTFPNAELVGLDIGLFAHCLTNASVLPETELDQQLFMDVRDVSTHLLDGFDAVVNLAAISNDPMGNRFETATMAINFSAGVRIAELAKQQGARAFVFASSCSVYGATSGHDRKEHDPLNPLTAYAKSKIESETALKRLADPDFLVTCLRFPTACGMSPRLRLDLVLNDFVASAVATGRIEILSDGTPWRPLIDTNDMALAIEWAIGRGTSGGDFLAINAGNNESNHQVKQIAEIVRQEIPEVEIGLSRHAAPDKRSYRVNFDLYKTLAPDHQPRVNILGSVRALTKGLTQMKFADPHFRDSHYTRLNVLGEHIKWGRVGLDLRLDATATE